MRQRDESAPEAVFDTCPYCGEASVVVAPYHKTIVWDGAIPVEQDGEMLHCTNPACPEPDRLSYEQRRVLDGQLREQLRTSPGGGPRAVNQ